MHNPISKNFYELIYYNMKEFNMKQWLMENKSGAYSKTASSLNEINPAALGAPQAAADAKMQQQDDENGDMVDNASMDVMAEEPNEDMTGFVNKAAPAETGLSKYLDLIHNHDWFHHFSDDPRAWRQGQAEKADLKSLYSTLTPDEKQKAMDAFIDKYLQIHDPKQFPNAANNVKYLTTNTFKGSI